MALMLASHAIDCPLVLAPMAGITDTVYRRIMRALGAGAVVSELVSAHGIIQRNRRTYDLLRFDASERPVGLQLFGEDAELTGAAARLVERLEPDFVDLNFGCPVPKVVCKGAGSAMLKNPAHLERFLKVVRRCLAIPLTIKIRTGWDDASVTAVECVKAAGEAGCAWVAIHGRTRAQGYSGNADWDLIARCKSAGTIPVIGNGDVVTAAQAVDRLTTTGCDGVMIGRGALRNPWIFQDARALLSAPCPSAAKVGPPPRSSMQFLDLLAMHRRLLDEAPWYHMPVLHLRKFAAWYSHGLPGSATFRRQVFQAPTLDAVFDLAHAFFESVSHVPVEHKSTGFFMNSGHG